MGNAARIRGATTAENAARSYSFDTIPRSRGAVRARIMQERCPSEI
jgi:hypothetical protein